MKTIPLNMRLIMRQSTRDSGNFFTKKKPLLINNFSIYLNVLNFISVNSQKPESGQMTLEKQKGSLFFELEVPGFLVCIGKISVSFFFCKVMDHAFCSVGKLAIKEHHQYSANTDFKYMFRNMICIEQLFLQYRWI